jgi:hypothetical protein
VAIRVQGGSGLGVRTVDVVAGADADLEAVSKTVTKELAELFGLELAPGSLKVIRVGEAVPREREGETAALASAETDAPGQTTGTADAAGPAAAKETGSADIHVGDDGRGRARIHNVSVLANGTKAEARVALTYGGREWTGESQGPNTSSRRLRLIAEATLYGLEGILSDSNLFSIEDLRVVEMSDGPVVVVQLEMASRRPGQRLTGSCAVLAAHGSVEEAVVRATLQAVNRLFSVFVGEGPLPA